MLRYLKQVKNNISYPCVTFKNKPLAAVKTFCIGGGGTTNLWHNGLMPMHVDDITSSEFRAILCDAENISIRLPAAFIGRTILIK